jgi:hypothetical protein
MRNRNDRSTERYRRMDEIYENWDGRSDRYRAYGNVNDDPRDVPHPERRRYVQRSRPFFEEDRGYRDYVEQRYHDDDNRYYNERDGRYEGEEEGYAGRNSNDYRQEPEYFYSPERRYRGGAGYEYADQNSNRQYQGYDQRDDRDRYQPADSHGRFNRWNEDENAREWEYREQRNHGDFRSDNYRRRRPNIRESRY